MSKGVSDPPNGGTTDPSALLETVGKVGHWRLDRDSGQIAVSAMAGALLGLEPGARHDRGAFVAAFAEADRPAVATLLDTAADAPPERDATLEARRAGRAASVPAPAPAPAPTPAPVSPAPSGARDPAILRLIAVPAPGHGVVGAVQDVTDMRALEADLACVRERHEDFAGMSDEWLWEMDAEMRFSYMSPQVEEIAGVPAAFHIGKTRRDLLGDKNASLEMEMHLAWLDQRKPFRDFRYWRLGPDGRQRYLSVTGKPVFGADGGFLGYRGTGRDLTGQQEIREALLQVNRQLNGANKAKSDAMQSLKEANALLEERNAQMQSAQAEIRHTALHDPLTGLANRRYLDERLSEMAARCRSTGEVLGALHADLDRFKQINDTLGHAAGDTVLQHVARLLNEAITKGDFVARVGGDEFVIVCIGRDEAGLRELAASLIERLSRPLEIDGRPCWFGGSVGIALMQGAEIDPGQILSNSDMALYRAKARGRGCLEVFSAELQEEILQRRALSDGVHAALERREFVPWYQPQICARTQDICGVEALARWTAPDGTIHAPGVFLAAAEDLGAVPAIDRMILETALGDLAAWDAAGLGIPKLSVNVSARRLLERDLGDSLAPLALPAGRVAFELLESVFLDDPDREMAWNIDLLKELGIEIALDDFGSGHASIIGLVKLGPDTIKIDRQLIQAITADPARRALVQSIVGIGRTLGVRVVAEGVETHEHAEMLADMGCDVLQGYCIARPMPAAEVPGFVARWRDRSLPQVDPRALGAGPTLRRLG